MLVLGILAGVPAVASRAAILLIVAAVLPLPAYRATLPRLLEDRRPLRTASDCLRRLEAREPSMRRGLYVDVPAEDMTHPLYYYFRRVRPWLRVDRASPEALARYLDDPAEQRPILVSDDTYQAFMNAAPASGAGGRRQSPPMANFPSVSLLLPGPFAECSSDTAR
jgi:hypothetical protein